jgi:hypothetical protein
MKLFKILILPILFLGCSQKKVILYNKIDIITEKVSELKKDETTKDCSDLVTKLNRHCGECYYKEVDLREYMSINSKTKMIYKNFEKRGLIYSSLQPNVADLIFFDNTYDSNRNGILDDELTHIGVVTDTNKGKINFVHNIRGKNIDGFIDLSDRYNRTNNSYIRACNYKEKKEDCLTSTNFRAYGRLE